MKHLSIPKIGFGILMTFLLAFGVQGTADALTFGTTRTGDLQTVTLSNATEFKISFSVSLDSNTTAIKKDGKLVSDDRNTRINSSGYKVTDVGTSEYRKINTDVTLTDSSGNSLSGGKYYYLTGTTTYTEVTLSNSTAVVSNGSTDSRAQVYYVSGTNAYTVYYSTTDPPTSSNRKAVYATPDAKVDDTNRYHYNQESISITVPESTTLKKVESYTVSKTGGSGVTHTMDELKDSEKEKKLSSTTIDLTYTATDVGTYTITIRDTTDSADRPLGTTLTSLTFTVYVVEQGINVASNATLSLGNSVIDGHQTRHAVDNILSVTVEGDENIPLRFEVLDGPGQFYVRVDSDRKTSKKDPLDTSSAAAVNRVFFDMNGSTNRVRVSVPSGPTAVKPVTVIYSYGHPSITISDDTGNNQYGSPNAQLPTALSVKVTDEKGSTISGFPVKFDPSDNGVLVPIPGTTVYVDENNVWGISDFTALRDTKTVTIHQGITNPRSPTAGTAAWVQTDNSGIAEVYLRLGNVGAHTVQASIPGTNTRFDATARVTAGLPTIEIASGNNQRSDDNGNLESPLVVRVKDAAGSLLQNKTVTFTTTKGYLTVGSSSNRSVTDITDQNGEASAIYQLGNYSGAATVVANITNASDATPTYNLDVTFNINGTGSTTTPPATQQPTPQQPTTTPTTFTVSPSSITGAPGSTQTLTVTTPAGSTAQVGNIILGQYLNAGGSASPTTGTGSFTSTLTLPSTAGTYNLIVNIGSDRRTIPVTVSTTTTTTQTGTLSVSVPFSGAPGSQQQATVTATDSAGTAASGVTVTLAVTNGGGTFSPASVTTGTNGTATSTLTRGTASGTNYFATATATGYTEYRTRLSITGGSTPPTTTTPTTPTTTPTTPAVSGDPSSIKINGQSTRSGATVNQALAAPLVVEVLDSNSRSVAEARVVFQVKTGQGRLSQRGNGRAIAVETDSRGYARATYTPLSANSTVEARVGGVTERVTFTITTGAATPDTGTSGTAGAKTYKRGDAISLSSDGILRFTDKRTVNGTVYTCVSSEECVIAYGTLSRGEIEATAVPKVEAKTYKRGDAISLSPDGVLRFTDKHRQNGAVYTCVSSGECVVAYGTLSKGEIQVSMATASIPSDAARPIDPEVLMGAAQRPPMLWVDGGSLYALVGADVQEFATGIENVQNLAVSGNKVYWTERTGENAGTINAMNLDGTGAKQLVSIKAVPQGIAVDSVGKRLYWTNSHGWIQSSNLQGTARRNVAKGLSNPMGIAVAAGKTVYWTEEGPSSPELLNGHTGQSVPGVSVAISGNTLYWTQRTGENAGTIHSVNLNGTGAKQLVSIKAVPMGITVDSAGKRLYWTNSHGWIQSSNLQGTARRNVAKGLGSPGGIALSANIKAPATTKTPTKTPTPAKPNYDVDGSGTVDNADLFLVSLAVGTNNAKYDLNGDGTVNDKDIALVRDNRDNGAAAAPMVVGVKLTAEQVDRLQAQIDLLIASGDRSPDALKTLVYLQQLIATARPEKTQLLANYPNPFNPETWIPYELATDTNVRITIYNAQGVVIRTLQLGQQSAGYYTDRERAAYWDGRNALGEQVASGVYFYQLETDEMSALRKMVILK